MQLDFINELNKVVDYSALDKKYVIREGFVFEAIRYPANVYNAIVVRSPESARAWGEGRYVSEHSLEEHINLINTYQLESAVIIAEDLNFLKQCPSLKHINVIPAESVDFNFDFTPIYEHPEIRSIFCSTFFGKFFQNRSEIDYSQIHGLVDLRVTSSSHLNFHQVQTLKSLEVVDIPAKNLRELFCSQSLDTLQITASKIQTLDGIGLSSAMQCLYLNYNRSLQDISALCEVKSSLRSLRIENCSKITDFSVLRELKNLEHLKLTGRNKLSDLSFVRDLPNLKTFIFDVEVLDGDLTPCLGLSYVHCSKMKKYYNVKPKDLPKGQYYRGNDNIAIWRRVQ